MMNGGIWCQLPAPSYCWRQPSALNVVVLVVIWAYLHHFIAGIRHLFMDVHLGLEKDSSRNSAIAVFAISLLLWVAFALKIFGAF